MLSEATWVAAGSHLGVSWSRDGECQYLPGCVYLTFSFLLSPGLYCSLAE